MINTFCSITIYNNIILLSIVSLIFTYNRTYREVRTYIDKCLIFKSIKEKYLNCKNEIMMHVY